MGPVDDPHDPPCSKCKREGKECFFSRTRRKRKHDDPEEEEEEEVKDLDEYEVRNGRKRLRARSPLIASPVLEHIASSTSPRRPLTPGGSEGTYQPLRRPDSSHQPHGTEEDDETLNNNTTAMLQSQEVHSGHDALALLYLASHRPGSNGGNNLALSPQNSVSVKSLDGRSKSRSVHEAFDPALAHIGVNGQPPPDSKYEEAVTAWTRFRFVRAGWMTAKEAISYVDYFYKYLSPLTPIVVPEYRDYGTHISLVRDEPMLTLTILTIASRYMPLEGSGAKSRTYAIHDKLSKYLQKMIDRLIWGQEQFGGGFCGAGGQKASDVNPLSRRGLRTLGSIESLMLLTEWHASSLHFPPGDDDCEIFPLDDDTLGGTNSDGGFADYNHKVGGHRIDTHLEPCWRSDRMCWMLLGIAKTLSTEIGVFDLQTEREGDQKFGRTDLKFDSYNRRKNHLRELLQIYLSQTSGRIGLTSMLPKAEKAFLSSDLPGHLFASPLVNNVVPPANARQKMHDTVLLFWRDLASIMHDGNLQMFANRNITRDLIRSEKYVELLTILQPRLQGWLTAFENNSIIPIYMKHVLRIEFEYTRVYMNCLALQAIVERCTRNTPVQEQASTGGAIPFTMLLKCYGNDRKYISEVIEASRIVLKIVVEGLYPGGYLKHSPVRTFFRIVSVAMILLKTFALGAFEDDVAISLTLMDRAVQCIRSSIVDDVHVGNGFADLLETLTNRIRSRFVRMATKGNSGQGVSRAASRSPGIPSAQATMMPPPLTPSNNPWSSYSLHNTAGSPSFGNTPRPLNGIATEAFDPSATNITVMPPPSYPMNFAGGNYDAPPLTPNNTNPFNIDMGGVGVGENGDFSAYNNQDWLALPLDDLVQSYSGDVTTTPFGPNIGGYDMLDILAPDRSTS